MHDNTHQPPPADPTTDPIPPSRLLGPFAAGGLIQPRLGDTPVVVATDGTRNCAGMMFVAPLAGGPWRDLGVATADGLCVPSEQQGRQDQLTAEGIRMAVSSGTVTASRPGEPFVWDDFLRGWGRATAPTQDIIGKIDRTLARLCPCGAESRPNNRYCSDDCVPTHRGPHTSDRSMMRWRPDLVSNIDDTGLTVWRPRRQHGEFWVEVFERAGTELLHLRVDDGTRHVGADLARDPADDFDERYAAKLQALLRELENPRHAVPVPRPGNLHEQAWLQHLGSVLGQRARTDRYPHFNHLHLDIRVDVAPMLRAMSAARAAVSQIFRAMSQTGDLLRRGGLIPPPAIDERAETLRRIRAARNTGPQHPPRAPKKINARRAR